LVLAGIWVKEVKASVQPHAQNREDRLIANDGKLKQPEFRFAQHPNQDYGNEKLNNECNHLPAEVKRTLLENGCLGSLKQRKQAHKAPLISGRTASMRAGTLRDCRIRLNRLT
jgi:hypothetical protein